MDSERFSSVVTSSSLVEEGNKQCYKLNPGEFKTHGDMADARFRIRLERLTGVTLTLSSPAFLVPCSINQGIIQQ